MIRPKAAIAVARCVLGKEASDTAVQLAASLIRLAVDRDEEAQRDERERLEKAQERMS